MTYRLQDGVLEVATEIENMSAEPMPVSVGFHPYVKLTDSTRDEWTISIPAKTHWLLAQTNQQARFQQPNLEEWLRQRLKANIGFDRMVRELLTEPAAGNQPFPQGGASAFFQANENKPENAIPKIVEGRLNGFYKENVLLEQAFVRDPKTTIGKLVSDLGPGAEVRRFARVKIGED